MLENKMLKNMILENTFKIDSEILPYLFSFGMS